MLTLVVFIPEEIISEILEKTDITELISSYFPLQSAGKNYKTLCPFHREKSPSFTISPINQRYYCFGCQATGDAIQFLKEQEGLTFIESAQKLAERANVIIPDSPKEKKGDSERKRLLEIHEKLAENFHQHLLKSTESSEARRYLQQRKYDIEVAKEWKIGWATANFDILKWARENRYSLEELEKAGIINLNDKMKKGFYFRWGDRLIFPIHDTGGNIVGFSGRLLKEKENVGKYINSPETLLFKKSQQFFGLHKARSSIFKKGYAFICEGQFDVIRCKQNQIENSIAPLGTAFTESQAQILRRYTRKVILCFDSDFAGIKASQSAFIQLSKADIYVNGLFLPKNMDPDAYISASSTDQEFQKRIEESEHYLLSLIRHQGIPQNLNEKNAYIEKIANLASHIKEPIQKQTLSDYLSKEFNIRFKDFYALILNQKEEKRRFLSSLPASKIRGENEEKMHPDIANLCYLLIECENSREWIREHQEILEKDFPRLEGTSILETLIRELPPAKQSPSKFNAFLANHFSEEEQKTIGSLLQNNLFNIPIQATREITAKLAKDGILEKIEKKQESFKNPKMTEEEILAIQKEILDLKASMAKISNLNLS